MTRVDHDVSAFKLDQARGTVTHRQASQVCHLPRRRTFNATCEAFVIIIRSLICEDAVIDRRALALTSWCTANLGFDAGPTIWRCEEIGVVVAVAAEVQCVELLGALGGTPGVDEALGCCSLLWR